LVVLTEGTLKAEGVVSSSDMILPQIKEKIHQFVEKFLLGVTHHGYRIAVLCLCALIKEGGKWDSRMLL
jgi:hypothetical protein